MSTTMMGRNKLTRRKGTLPSYSNNKNNILLWWLRLRFFLLFPLLLLLAFSWNLMISMPWMGQQDGNDVESDNLNSRKLLLSMNFDDDFPKATTTTTKRRSNPESLWLVSCETRGIEFEQYRLWKTTAIATQINWEHYKEELKQKHHKPNLC